MYYGVISELSTPCRAHGKLLELFGIWKGHYNTIRCDMYIENLTILLFLSIPFCHYHFFLHTYIGIINYLLAVNREMLTNSHNQ